MGYAKIGSGLYVLWGLLHTAAAYEEFTLGASLEAGLVQGKIYQGAWNLLFFALASIVIAVVYNWKNRRLWMRAARRPTHWRCLTPHTSLGLNGSTQNVFPPDWETMDLKRRVVKIISL